MRFVCEIAQRGALMRCVCLVAATLNKPEYTSFVFVMIRSIHRGNILVSG